MQAIREEIERVVRDEPYPLSVSVGYDELLGDRDTIQSCIQRADEKLYRDKKIRKTRPPRAAASRRS